MQLFEINEALNDGRRASFRTDLVKSIGSTRLWENKNGRFDAMPKKGLKECLVACIVFTDGDTVFATQGYDEVVRRYKEAIGQSN